MGDAEKQYVAEYSMKSPEISYVQKTSDANRLPETNGEHIKVQRLNEGPGNSVGERLNSFP